MRTLRESYISLINMGSRKRQDLLSKLGPWRGLKERGKKEREQRKMYRSIKSILIKEKIMMTIC